MPFLWGVDFAFHELGHLLAWMLPSAMTILAGSLTQAAVPLGLAAYFWSSRKDLMATGLMLGWAGTSWRDVSVYIADAPYRDLPLHGGEPSMHDWGNLLGPGRWDALDAAGGIARDAARSVQALAPRQAVSGRRVRPGSGTGRRRRIDRGSLT